MTELKANQDRSLKSQNFKWLLALSFFDFCVLALLTVPQFFDFDNFREYAIRRLLLVAVMPVLVLLLVHFLSHEAKAVLVFWKLRHSLPGCRAFTAYGANDPRIDSATLEKNVGELPTAPMEQNKKWFKLYKLVAGEPVVVEAHKMYLLFRDMSAISVLLLLVCPIALWSLDHKNPTLFRSALLFLVQYLICIAGARNNGRRFVCNVLSIHSTKKVVGAKAR